MVSVDLDGNPITDDQEFSEVWVGAATIGEELAIKRRDGISTVQATGWEVVAWVADHLHIACENRAQQFEVTGSHRRDIGFGNLQSNGVGDSSLMLHLFYSCGRICRKCRFH